eukprot:NODE_1152_length_1866_cov_194.805508_g1092_i0.p1 GENE.NODE_1152_length_1866_cov_194.805508_g1092_i0~~NODE_1152_length_1866_cov_194.805508_g1092_i0.p1  ORF type:complete len:498 (+),score=49.32 NODE_1152_length_1866_cov_194.805508_g1092_i0:129-1622(+)
MPKIPSTLGNRFRIVRKIGGGGFGMVFEAKDLQTGNTVAVKVEFLTGQHRTLLQFEARICEGFSRIGGNGKAERNELGFPTFYQYGSHSNVAYIAMEKLGPSLDLLLKYCRPRLSLKTVLILAEQSISRIERFHSKGLVHRDIKPHNFSMGWGKNGMVLYLIDFGLATRFCNSDHVHMPFTTGKGLIGTPWFCSINAHEGNELSRRDDLESLFYVFAYLLRGSLPWQTVRAATQAAQNAAIREQKVGTALKLLLSELPAEFVSFYNYVRSLGFKKKPNYSQMRKLFEGLFEKQGFIRDDNFDWVVRHQIARGKEEFSVDTTATNDMSGVVGLSHHTTSRRSEVLTLPGGSTVSGNVDSRGPPPSPKPHKPGVLRVAQTPNSASTHGDDEKDNGSVKSIGSSSQLSVNSSNPGESGVAFQRSAQTQGTGSTFSCGSIASVGSVKSCMSTHSQGSVGDREDSRTRERRKSGKARGPRVKAASSMMHENGEGDDFDPIVS